MSNSQTTDRLNQIATKLHNSDAADHALREATQECQDAKWELIYALIENDPQLAAGVMTVSKRKLHRALRNLLKRDDY